MSITTNLQLLRRRRTRIVATLGPASSDETTLAALVEAGVDVVRLNMSHGEHASHARTFDTVRRVAAAAGRHVAVLADLAGPKIRVGRFEGGGIDLIEGEPVTLTMRDVPGVPGLIPSQYTGLARDVRAGVRVLLADGVMELRVESVAGDEVHCVVVQGGRLTDRKGINLPDVAVSAPCLTTKDRADARFALDLGVDFLGLSFVRRASDIDELKTLIAEHGTPCAVVAKIERPEALADSDAILDATDAVMVARGDLGVELPPEQVPIAQLALIADARRRGKPVIVATHMLESMIDNPRPTRAEVSDVSTAVLTGADAVMLSGETASGAHPVAAVRMMDRIARQAEGYQWHQGAFGHIGDSAAAAPQPPLPFGDAVARAVAQLSRDLRPRAIVVVSHGGMSAATVSSARPAAPVVAVSDNQATCRRMNLLWGVVPEYAPAESLEDPRRMARRLATTLQLAEPGEYILLVRGFHRDYERNTPTITLIGV